MFNKNKNKEKPAVNYGNTDYINWESDFGFLTLLINRKVTLAIQYNIKALQSKLEANDYIRDIDINDVYENIVNEIVTTMSDNYKNFLINKYFSSEKALIGFISEIVLNELIQSSIIDNNDKIRSKYSQELAEKLLELNTKKENNK